jgi:hypothetical protein
VDFFFFDIQIQKGIEKNNELLTINETFCAFCRPVRAIVHTVLPVGTCIYCFGGQTDIKVVFPVYGESFTGCIRSAVFIVDTIIKTVFYTCFHITIGREAAASNAVGPIGTSTAGIGSTGRFVATAGSGNTLISFAVGVNTHIVIRAGIIGITGHGAIRVDGTIIDDTGAVFHCAVIIVATGSTEFSITDTTAEGMETLVNRNIFWFT